MSCETAKKAIRLLVMDVDGTLTDGKIYMGPSGEAFKAFDIKDGYGVNEILPEAGITPAIITGRESEIVARRANELGVKELYQGRHDKLATFEGLIEKLGLARENVAYIGDDILDLVCMRRSGLVGCPADACRQVIEAADYVCSAKGGEGAVREFIEWLIAAE